MKILVLIPFLLAGCNSVVVDPIEATVLAQECGNNEGLDSLIYSSVDNSAFIYCKNGARFIKERNMK